MYWFPARPGPASSSANLVNEYLLTVNGNTRLACAPARGATASTSAGGWPAGRGSWGWRLIAPWRGVASSKRKKSIQPPLRWSPSAVGHALTGHRSAARQRGTPPSLVPARQAKGRQRRSANRLTETITRVRHLARRGNTYGERCEYSKWSDRGRWGGLCRAARRLAHVGEAAYPPRGGADPGRPARLPSGDYRAAPGGGRHPRRRRSAYPAPGRAVQAGPLRPD